METFLVYTVSKRQNGQAFSQEVGRESVPNELAHLEATRDYIVNKEGKLFKVLEKIADLKSDELRILVREA